MNALRIIVLITSIMVAMSADAWDATTTFTSGMPADFAPTALSTPDAHGYWAAGTAGNSPVLVRYDTAMSAQFVRYMQDRFPPSYVALSAVPDGGVIVHEQAYPDSPNCSLRRYDATGSLRWTRDVPLISETPDAYYAYCAPLVVDGAGSVWLRTGNLSHFDGGDLSFEVGHIHHLSSDGAMDSTLSLDGLSASITLVGDPLGPNVYLMGRRNDATATSGTVPVIEKISGSGAVSWMFTPSAADYIAVSVALDGNLYAFGESSTTSSLYSVNLSPGGQLLWEHTDNTITTYILALAAAPDGSEFVLIGQGDNIASATMRLVKTGASGAVAWSTSINPLCDAPFSFAMRAATNGDAIISAVCADNGSTFTSKLLRFSGAGIPVFSSSSANTATYQLQVLADSSTLALDTHVMMLDANGNVLIPGGITLDHLAVDGSTAPPLATEHVIGALDSIGDVAFGSDGSAYLLVIDAEQEHYEFSRITPDGQVRWRQQHAGHWNSGGDVSAEVHVVLAGDAACIVGALDGSDIVICHNVENGTIEGTALLDGDPLFPPHARGLASGQLLVSFGAHLALMDTRGAVLKDTAPTEPYLHVTSSNASGLTLTASNDGTYAEYAADGTRRYSHIASGLGEVTQAYLADDGTGLLLSTMDSALQLSRLNTSGTMQWTRAIGASPPTADTPYNYASTIEVHGNDAYIVLGFKGDLPIYYPSTPIDDKPHDFPYLVEKISLADGSVTWTKTIDGILFNFPIAHLDANTQRLVAVSGWPNKIHTQVLAPSDGQVLNDRFEDCDADNCTLFNASLGSDGALRAIVDASSEGTGSFQRIFTRYAPFAQRTPVRLGQPGLDGAWFAPYESGQGFSLDYIASGATIFMPWFTYTQIGGNDPVGLAWYTLQGTVAPGATSADLDIGATEPGNFNSGTVGVHAVGTAHLSFSDCNSGSLYYQFNADTNNGAGGLISLTRLSPSTDPCTLANGSSIPAQIANAPAQGFDAHQSGTWFDPSTAGQGLEMSIIPPGNAFNGLVFAAWFTFDPANQSDDPAHQHWFTLQGDLSTAANGAVTLPILRTIGGSFDETPTGNTVEVGHATLTMQGCDQARLQYQFDESDVAHAFAGLSGTTNLVKIDGCTMP